MQFRRCVIVVLSLLVMFVCSSVMAQDAAQRVATQDLEGLYAKPFGVRNLGMGWVGVADGTVAENVYFNPANLVSHGGLEISAATQNWLEDLDFYNIGGAARFRIHVGENTNIHVAPGFWYAEQKAESYQTNTQGELVKSSTSDRYVNLALAAGLRATRWEFGLGAAVKPAWIDFEAEQEEKTAWAFDVGAKLGGLLFAKNGYNLTGHLGAGILNLGSDVEGDRVVSEMPTEMRLGLAFLFQTRPVDTRVQRDIPGVKLYLNGEIIGRSLQDDVDTGAGTEKRPLGSAVGAEMCLINTFNFRIGYLDDGIDGQVQSVTWGLGVQFANEKFRFALDLSHLPEIYADGPSVTSTGLGMSWYY